MDVESTFDQQPPDRDSGPTVLIVDDEESDRHRLKRVLRSTVYGKELHIPIATSSDEALRILCSTPAHVVLLDKNLGPKGSRDGISIIPDMLHLQPHVQILMVTGSASVEDVVQAMRHGAFGYVTKEMKDEYVAQQISKAIALAQFEVQKNRAEKTGTNKTKANFVGKSHAAIGVMRQIQAVAESNRPVLLTGETGTGKTTIAEFIHEYRRRYLKQHDRPFFTVNISTLSANVVEAELFGSEKGAFTGSVRTKQGFFELVNGGTLFLDEVGEITPDIQKKLLTVLESGTFYRIGGTKELRSSFKLICATNKDLKELTAQGKFREDLYMRISTFSIEIPPLKDRLEDIPEIVRSLLPKCCRENNVHVSFEELPDDFMEFLATNIPPGNIRGIEQQLSRLLVFSPRDRGGRPLLTHWRMVSGLQQHASGKRSSRSSLTLGDLMSLPLDVVGPDFPGLSVLIDSIEERVLLDAKTKFTQNRQIARALKLSDSAIGTRLRRLERTTFQ